MPKQVDRHARRRLIAEALWRVALRQGLEDVSLRHVAAEAGVSMGMVQHYFVTKDQLLLFALATLNERVTRRVGERIAGLADQSSPRSLVLSVLLEMLPLDEQRHADAVVGFAFVAQATVRPTVAVVLRESVAQLQGFVATQIHHAREGRLTQPVVDPEREAAALLALVDGLAMQSLIGIRSPETALTILDEHLDRLFPTGEREGDNDEY